MAKRNRKLAYSTDPEPEPEAKPIKLPANPAAAIPGLQKNEPVRVFRDRSGRRGKTVSVIRGVKSPPEGKKALLKHLKSKLGTGGAIKDGDIEIQGEQREKIVVLLNDLGYKAKVAGG
jgi:translation initiation factor 1